MQATDAGVITPCLKKSVFFVNITLFYHPKLKPILKQLLTILSLVCTFASYSQSKISKINECQFFDSIKIWQQDFNRTSYLKIKANYSERISLIQKLEAYVVVFDSFTIAPMYLQKDTDRRACKLFLDSFKFFRSIKGADVQKARGLVQKHWKRDVFNLILDLTDLNKPDTKEVEKYLAEYLNSTTLELLYFLLKDKYYDAGNPLNNLPTLVKDANLQLLAKRMDKMDQHNFMYYENYYSQPNFIKGFEMYHENDVILPFAPGMNQDRELTGGFKFTLITDYLKWRWLRVGWKKEDNILTYQTFSLVGSGYTPYIRYRNNYDFADSLHKFDSPFSSFFCFERAKHRTWRDGLVRQKGEFQIGSMGISQGRKIQAKLHEDVNTLSQFVHGWDKQIANSGRLVIQVNQKADFLLYSNTNRYATILRPNNYHVDERFKKKGCVKGMMCKDRCHHKNACKKDGGG